MQRANQRRSGVRKQAAAATHPLPDAEATPRLRLACSLRPTGWSSSTAAGQHPAHAYNPATPWLPTSWPRHVHSHSRELDVARQLALRIERAGAELHLARPARGRQLADALVGELEDGLEAAAEQCRRARRCGEHRRRAAQQLARRARCTEAALTSTLRPPATCRTTLGNQTQHCSPAGSEVRGVWLREGRGSKMRGRGGAWVVQSAEPRARTPAPHLPQNGPRIPCGRSVEPRNLLGRLDDAPERRRHVAREQQRAAPHAQRQLGLQRGTAGGGRGGGSGAALDPCSTVARALHSALASA